MTRKGQGRVRRQNVHPLVAETALEMAHVVYAGLMNNNLLYDGWKKMNEGLTAEELEEKFCQQTAGQMIPQARAVLAGMLRGPYDEGMKDKIAEALLLDNTLGRGRAEGRKTRPLSGFN